MVIIVCPISFETTVPSVKSPAQISSHSFNDFEISTQRLFEKTQDFIKHFSLIYGKSTCDIAKQVSQDKLF